MSFPGHSGPRDARRSRRFPDDRRRQGRRETCRCRGINSGVLDPIRRHRTRIGGGSPDNRVTSIRHCGDNYFIHTEDGASYPYWEKNVRLKIDSTETGPPEGTPVILGAGMRGDRVSVIFKSVADLSRLLVEECR